MKSRALALVAALALTLSPLAQPTSVQQRTLMNSTASAAAADVVGTGFWTALGCAACVAGAAAIVAGGPGAVLVAATAQGSFWVAAACVGACAAAFN